MLGGVLGRLEGWRGWGGRWEGGEFYLCDWFRNGSVRNEIC